MPIKKADAFKNGDHPRSKRKVSHPLMSFRREFYLRELFS